MEDRIMILCADGAFRDQKTVERMIREGKLVATTGDWPPLTDEDSQC